MHISLIITAEELKRLVIEHLKTKLGDVPFEVANLEIETKSKLNYKAEWERADFRATYTGFGH